ncbi:nitrite reductase/ring-hydroxylating ferredoxin subunit [Agrobacterium vitis]|nr:nitrite reductase/ring-hydroxylating ferredoxin subunit [Agrobacterium vitis]MBE1439445.1 nitrite reductase/ring-hydroxylating ferredoxin subunit [Agrobacterium vitis]
MLPYKNDQWVPVALSADVPKGTVVPAWIPEGRLALWRSQSGVLAASSDRCPHRGMRLSHGFVRGEALSCIYHGWSYASDGRCQRIPAHPGLALPETINLRNSIVKEQDGMIWVARTQPQEEPPTLTATVPLKTMMVDAGISALESATGAKANEDGLMFCTLAGENICLLLVAQSACETLTHILVDQNTTTKTRIILSRCAETLRRTAEAIHGRGEA